MVIVAGTNGTQQVVNDPQGTKAVDTSTGIQSVRGSQRVGDGLLTSVTAAYANLVYHPIALAMLLVGVFILIAELNNTHGPLEYLLSLLLDYIREPLHPQWLKNVASIVIMVVSALVKYKTYVASLCLIFFTTVSKPSSRTMTISIILAVVLVYIRNVSILDVLILSQLFYLYCNLRTPSHKFIVAVITIAVFATNMVDVEKLAEQNAVLKSMSDKKLTDMYRADIQHYDSTLQAVVSLAAPKAVASPPSVPAPASRPAAPAAPAPAAAAAKPAPSRQTRDVDPIASRPMGRANDNAETK